MMMGSIHLIGSSKYLICTLFGNKRWLQCLRQLTPIEQSPSGMSMNAAAMYAPTCSRDQMVSAKPVVALRRSEHSLACHTWSHTIFVDLEMAAPMTHASWGRSAPTAIGKYTTVSEDAA